MFWTGIRRQGIHLTPERINARLKRRRLVVAHPCDDCSHRDHNYGDEQVQQNIHRATTGSTRPSVSPMEP